VVCWGSNGYGQATPPDDLGPVTQITAGGAHTCAIKSVDATVVCWGANGSGQATPPDDLGPVAQIAAGGSRTCAIKSADETVVCWGANGSGQTVVPVDLGPVIQIALGDGHICAIKSADGTVVCWGQNGQGQTTVPSDLGAVTQIDLGASLSCAIKSVDATVVCWGFDGDGEIVVPAGLGPVLQITAGEFHVCAVKVDGVIACWGYSIDDPITPPADIGAVREISAGGWHTCALKVDGSVLCWGAGYSERLGGAPSFISSPPPSLIGSGPFSHTYVASPPTPPAAVRLAPRFFVSSGTLPPGLALDEATGELSGTPTADGTWAGVVTATNDVFIPDATQPFSITVDSTSPAAPTGLGSTPTSPSPDQTPQITGIAEAGSTVRLYGDSGCTGAPLGSGSATAFAAPGLQISIAADSATTIHATATDVLGRTSPCSPSGTTYIHQTPHEAPGDPDQSGTPKAPEQPAGPSDPGKPAVSTPVVVTGLRSDTRCLGGARRARKDITVRYTTREAATLTFTLQRRTAPRLVAPTTCPRALPDGDNTKTSSGERITYKNATAVPRRHGKARVLTFTRSQRAGSHSFKLLRAFRTAAPTPGFYRLIVKPATATGERGRTSTLYLWVTAPSKARTGL
jgi:hypothetical protein